MNCSEAHLEKLREAQLRLANHKNVILQLSWFLRLFRRSELKEIESRLDSIEMEIYDHTSEYPKLIREMEHLNKTLGERLEKLTYKESSLATPSSITKKIAERSNKRVMKK